MMEVEIWKNSLSEAERVLESFLANNENLQACVKFSEILYTTFQAGGNLFVCGNGGSHCDAMHFAEEWTGRFRKERPPMGALALGDPSHVTCVGNDYGFEHIFARQIAGLGRKGDLLVGISTSGNSKNIILAIEEAQQKGLQTVALLGRDGGSLVDIAAHSIVVPAQSSDRIQEVHIKIIHTVIESVERRLFPQNYS